MSDKVAKQPLGSLKVTENNFCYPTTCFKVWIIAHCSSNDFLLLLIRVTEASIPVPWRQLNSTVSIALEFLPKTMKYTIPGRAIFDEVFAFVVVPVINDIKNCIPEICRICSSNKYLALQTDCASLSSFVDHTVLQDIAWDFSLTFKRKVNVFECMNVNQYFKAINV